MAFNLNKNDETNPTEDSSKKSNSKFDLSKNKIPSVENEDNSSKSKIWILVLLGLLLIGGGTWYYLSNSKTVVATTDESSVTSTVEPNTQAPSEVNQNTDSTTAANGATSTSSTDNSSASNTDTPPNGNAVAEKSNSSNNQSVASTNTTATSGVTTSLNNKVSATFGLGSASVSEVDQSLVKEVITFLQKNPNSSVIVSGYASSEGELSANQRISQLRADAFKNYLISKGVSEVKINASGKGVDNPIASNDTEEGRQKNRRVEITLQ